MRGQKNSGGGGPHRGRRRTEWVRKLASFLGSPCTCSNEKYLSPCAWGAGNKALIKHGRGRGLNVVLTPFFHYLKLSKECLKATTKFGPKT